MQRLPGRWFRLREAGKVSERDRQGTGTHSSLRTLVGGIWCQRPRFFTAIFVNVILRRMLLSTTHGCCMEIFLSLTSLSRQSATNNVPLAFVFIGWFNVVAGQVQEGQEQGKRAPFPVIRWIGSALTSVLCVLLEIVLFLPFSPLLVVIVVSRWLTHDGSDEEDICGW